MDMELSCILLIAAIERLSGKQFSTEYPDLHALLINAYKGKNAGVLKRLYVQLQAIHEDEKRK